MPEQLSTVFLVGAGGFAGAYARYALAGVVYRLLPGTVLPWGTAVVNVAGCLAIGILGGLVESRQILGSASRLFLLIGFLGSFTTFSTFGYETLQLVRDGDWQRAGANVALQLAGGLTAVWLGFTLSRAGLRMATWSRGRLLRIFVGESDRHEGEPLYQWLVARARESGLAGATVLRGLEGYGAHSQVHTTRFLRLAAELPIVVEIVDTPERIAAFLPRVEEAVSEGLATLEDVDLRLFRRHETARGEA